MRSLWHGALNFALLSVSVKMFKATSEAKTNFHMLHKECNTRINMRRWCEKCQKFLEWNDLVKGYEIDEEHYIIFTDEELESLVEGGSKSIKLEACVESSKIDEVAIGEPYYLVPEKGFERVYLLLREALQSTRSCLVGNWVSRGKEHYVSVKSHEGVLLLSVLRYAEEINNIGELPAIATKEMPSGEEINLGVELLKKFTKTDWTLPDSSIYASKFAELMNRKTIGGVIGVEKVKTEAKQTKPSDLMESLRKSIDAAVATGETK